MATSEMVFIGLVPITPHLNYEISVLDENRHLLRLEEAGQQDALSILSGYENATVALCLPPQLNNGMVNKSSQKHTGRGRPSQKRQNKRLCEYVLSRHGVKIPSTPAVLEDCPSWMKEGFSFYQQLKEIGFSDFSVPCQPRMVFETQPEGIFRSILCKPLLPLKSLEGRLQRLLILYDHGVRIADPMTFFEEVTRHRIIQGTLPVQTLMSIVEIESLAAAYMAWLMADQPHKTIRIGNEEEGILVLPIWNELDKTDLPEPRQMDIFS